MLSKWLCRWKGSFCVSFNKSKRHRFGWEVRPSFSVSQNSDRLEVLKLFQECWKIGSFRPDRSDNTIKYEVRSLKNLVSTVIPHFQDFPLISSKQNDFNLFSRICLRMNERGHLVEEGLIQIVNLAFEMNPSGKRRYQKEEILESLGDDIVYAPGKLGNQREVPTRTNGVMTFPLSQPWAQRNWTIGENTDYPQLDGKTL